MARSYTRTDRRAFTLVPRAALPLQERASARDPFR